MQDTLIAKWEFDTDVTAIFPDMLRRSIPQYDSMRETTSWLANHYQKTNTNIIDIGCSRGDALVPLITPDCKYYGLEISDPMIQVCKERFKDQQNVNILKYDLRADKFPVPENTCSVIQSILTIQFIPIEYRQRLLNNVYNALIDGGVFLLVEKVLGNTPEINSVFTQIYYDLKSKHGYSQEQIERKKLALEGVLVPLSAAWDVDMLRQSGFTQIDCYYRWCNFSGWLTVKN